MKEIDRIVELMKRGFGKEPWHGPSLMEVLKDVKPEQAAARPIKGAHTIWEIVMHVTTWQTEIVKRIDGYAGYPTDEEDYPPMPEATEENWNETLEKLAAAEQGIEEAVTHFDEARLDQPFAAGKTAAYIQFYGHLQHLAYHTGHILMLKRALQG